MSTEIESRLAGMQAKFPHVDVFAEYRRACGKYRREVDLGWLECAWLPRCRPVRRRSRAQRESDARTVIYLAAASPAEPLAWAGWFARAYPHLDPLPWLSAPIDMRQRFARDEMARPSKESIKPAA